MNWKKKEKMAGKLKLSEALVVMAQMLIETNGDSDIESDHFYTFGISLKFSEKENQIKFGQLYLAKLPKQAKLTNDEPKVHVVDNTKTIN